MKNKAEKSPDWLPNQQDVRKFTVFSIWNMAPISWPPKKVPGNYI